MTGAKGWSHLEARPEHVRGFFPALRQDIAGKKHQYLEALLRNIPGHLGISLRYHLLTRSFKSCGENVVMWQGIRIRHPQGIKVGNNVQLGADNHYQAWGGIQIGDDTLLGPNVKIWTINHAYTDRDRPIREQGYQVRRVEIGADCWLTTNVFVGAGVVIPAGCVVGAGSIVNPMRIPPYSIIVGNPARVLGPRDRMSRFKKVLRNGPEQKEPKP